MDINKKNRSDLKSYFVKNSIPTESNFSELIDGMLNQKDDGIVKLSGDPLSIEAAGDSTGLQKVINFYGKLQDANPAWSLQLNPRTDPNNTNTSKAGLCIADGLSTPRLFIDKNTGNVGIGTITPNAKLDVNGNLAVAGNIASTGTLVVTGAITPSAGNTETNGIMFPKDPFGGGGDAAWIRYYARSGEACTLEIGIANDADDHIALMPNAGNVGIGTNTPKAKLDINGNLAVTGNIANTGTLTVTGATALSNTLTVTGATTLSNVTLGGFTGADADEWPNVTWFRDTANNWDEGLIKHASTKGFFKRSGFGIHLHSSRDWTFFSSGWDALLGIEGGTGNTKIKGNLTVGGNIGIGTTNSVAKLDIAQAARTGIHPAAIKGLYITGDFGGDADGIEFRHTNGSQGIGFGYNTIYATGSNANQDLNLKAKGTGSVTVTGATTLANNLTVNGAIAPSIGNSVNNGLMFQNNVKGDTTDSAWLRYYLRDGLESMTLELGTSNDSDDHIALMPSGNVGIGTRTPNAKLDINGNLAVTGATTLSSSLTVNSAFYAGNSDIYFTKTDHNHSAFGNTSGYAAIENTANFGALMILGRSTATGRIVKLWDYLQVNGGLDVTGNVGIGITTPTQAKLVVIGSAPSTFNGYGYTNRNGAAATNTLTTANYSIYASDRIAAVEFNAFSDERIKISQGRSDNATDLQTLLGIVITDYHYKDVIGKGDAPHKKVIAQQVEQVFPQAVSKHTDVVPDIYQLAAVVDGWVELATDLQPGERVRLICDKVEGLYDVLEVTKDKFRADFKPDGDKVFVFGREVNDFCNVDYDAIAMLNVSATQQLKKEMDALKVENADLNARLAVLEAKI